MKKSLILMQIIILLLSAGIITAQKAPIKFGKISKEEIEMTVFEQDTTAEAVVLCDYGTAEISPIPNRGFVLVFKRHKRVKILKKSGLDQANVEVQLHVARENVEEDLGRVKGTTYNMENGKIVESKLSRKDVFEEDYSRHTKLKKFALPNVKVGSVIEYEYQITSEFLYLRTWYFQSEIPVIWSEYRTVIPEYFEFKHFPSPYHTPTISESSNSSGSLPGGRVTYITNNNRYVYKNLPAFRTEDYITTPKDYLAKVEFERLLTKIPGQAIQTHTTTWEEICNNFLQSESFGSALDRHGIVKELTEAIDASASPEEKVGMAYLAVKNKMVWNEYYGTYIEETLRKAYNEGKGSVAEINLILVNLLRSIGISANPVVLSTRSHGRVNKYFPKQTSFNYVIAAANVKGKLILLDASRDFLQPGTLSFNCLNGEGMMVTKNGPQWLNLRSVENKTISKTIRLNMNEDEGLTATVDERTMGLSARSVRLDIAKEGKDKYIEEVIENTSDWDMAEYKIENYEDLSKPLVEKYTILAFNTIDSYADIIYLPAIIGNSGENPFTEENRNYPVDFGVPINTRYILNFIIPEGYTIDEFPESSTIALPEKSAVFVYKAQLQGNILQVYSQTRINKTFFLPEEYVNLKTFYNHISEKLNEQIVLKRI